MNSALTYALYIIVSTELGEEAKMPTNQLYWEGYDDVSDSRLIANQTIWASTNADAGNQAFNITNGDYFSWRYMWPRVAEYLGGRATSQQVFTKPRPKEGETQLDLSLTEWSKDKRPVWDRICEKRGCPQAKASWDAATWAYQDWVFQRTWCATLSINKARKFGWTGHIDSFDSFTHAFEKFVELGQIPSFQKNGA
jgi:nucleoside-diphosphate-sugar epimerase